jgi:hypothetical protein
LLHGTVQPKHSSANGQGEESAISSTIELKKGGTHFGVDDSGECFDGGGVLFSAFGVAFIHVGITIVNFAANATFPEDHGILDRFNE